MRMWGAAPRRMCDKHILGEHLEMHMFHTALSRKQTVTGYITKNLLAPSEVKERHDMLAAEMLRRNMNHKSPMDTQPDISYLPYHLRVAELYEHVSEEELYTRCEKCAEINDQYIRHHERAGRLENLI